MLGIFVSPPLEVQILSCSQHHTCTPSHTHSTFPAVIHFMTECKSNSVSSMVTQVLICLIFQSCEQARSQGGGGGRGGGVVRPHPVAHPKDFVPPFSNFVPPFSNFVPPFSNFVPPFSNFVPPFSNFVPPFSNFVPPLEYVDDVTRAMSKGGCLWMSKSGGVFQIDDVTRTMSKGGGCAWCSTHPSSDPPPTWLAGYGPVWVYHIPSPLR